MRLKPSENISM